MQRTESAHLIARALKSIAILVLLLPAVAAADAAATSGRAACCPLDAEAISGAGVVSAGSDTRGRGQSLVEALPQD